MAKKLSMKERLQKRKEEIKKGGGDYATFLFTKEGTIRMRHLPVPEDSEFGVEITMFYLGGGVKSFYSPATFGDPCAVMEWYNKASKSKKETDREKAKKYRPKKVYGVPSIRFIDLKGKEPDHAAGEKLAIMKGQQYNELIDLFLDEDEAGDFTQPKTGYDVKHTRTGKGQYDTEYAVARCNPTPLDKKYAKKTYDPETMARELMPTYEETEIYLAQILSTVEDEDDDDDDTPKKKKSSSSDGSKKKKKKRSSDL